MGEDAPAPALGYPDMGAGTYARLLAYKDWFELNCAMRVHQNNVEHLSWTLPTFLMSGMFFPRATAALGVTVLGGRELYRYGYLTPEGPNNKIREYGAYPLNIAEAVGLLAVGFVCCRYQFGNFIKNRKMYKFLNISPLKPGIYEKELESISDKARRGHFVKTTETRTPGESSHASL
jgi:hypothetical protein